jgi:hypothetical protein
MSTTPQLLICAPHARAAEHTARYELHLPRRAYRIVTAGTNLCGYRDQPIYFVHIPGCDLAKRLSDEIYHGIATGALRNATADDVAAIRDVYTKTAVTS